MTTTIPPIRLFGPEGLLSAIPVLLGFHPTDSLVVACLIGAKKKLGPVIRVDLAECWPRPWQMAVQMGHPVSMHADRCMVVFYGTEADRFDFGALLGTASGIPVMDVLFVGNEPQRIDTRLHAEHVGLGHVVAQSRDELQAQVEFDPKADTPLDPDLIAAMRDQDSRDKFLADNIGQAQETLQRLLATCRRLVDEDPQNGTVDVGLAHLCASAALLAYRIWNGPLAQSASTERCGRPRSTGWHTCCSSSCRRHCHRRHWTRWCGASRRE